LRALAMPNKRYVVNTEYMRAERQTPGAKLPSGFFMYNVRYAKN
jgi:hypothetical protein